MPKRHLWRKVLPGLFLIVFLFFGYIFFTKGGLGIALLTFKSCSDPVFTVQPTMSEAYSLTPLGSINPPDHTLPTDHIYYIFPRNSASDPVPVMDVYMPGNVYLTGISYHESTGDPHFSSADYKLDFSPCGKVNAYYDHIEKLSPRLAAAFGQKPACDVRHPRPGVTYKYCDKNLYLKMTAGELVGQAGGATAAGFDFGANDSRAPKLQFVNLKKNRGEQDVVCPIDLFSGGVKVALEKHFQRTVPPVCGTIMQDKAGTAQGDWFYGAKDVSGPEGWQYDLALIHDNRDPTQGIISIGGVFTTPTRFMFQPTHEGSVDREFSEITPGPTLYCYQLGTLSPGPGLPPGAQQRILIQLVSASQLKIEHLDGSCNGAWNFSRPSIYNR